MSDSNSIPSALKETLHAVSANIRPPDPGLAVEARSHLDRLTKPLGSLGRLEDLATQLFSVRGGNLSRPFRKAVYIFAADHGITAEGVSAYPSEVTRQMVLNFLAGGAAINVLAQLSNACVTVVDVGVSGDLSASVNLVHRKVRHGSRNMLHEPAMSWDELTQALEVGLHLAQDAARFGYDLVAAGEMGIGNTTAAGALTAALTGSPSNLVTGRGTGLDPERFSNKVRIITAALNKHLSEALPPAAPADLLRRLGGLEIAAMTGFILGSAALGSIIVIDGFISTAAAAFAVAIAPNTRAFLFAGHLSEEPGHRVLLDHIGLAPILQLNMRLGEGTGAVLAMPLLEAARHLFLEMATFASAGVSEGTS